MGRKKNIWEGIAMKLQESGYSRSGDQCKTRMHNLQQKYKKVKSLNNTSGQGKNSFPFDEEIDKVLGHKPSINPLSTLSSVAGGSSSRSDNTMDALETKSVLSSVDGLGEESFLCEDVTAEDVSVNGSEDDDAPTQLLLKRSQNQSKGRRTKQTRKENSQSQHLLTKWKVSWGNFLKSSKSPRDDSWSLKNEEVKKKLSKKRKDDGSKQNRMRNEKTFFCVFKALHKAPVAAKIKVNTQFRSSFFNCL